LFLHREFWKKGKGKNHGAEGKGLAPGRKGVPKGEEVVKRLLFICLGENQLIERDRQEAGLWGVCFFLGFLGVFLVFFQAAKKRGGGSLQRVSGKKKVACLLITLMVDDSFEERP